MAVKGHHQATQIPDGPSFGILGEDQAQSIPAQQIKLDTHPIEPNKPSKRWKKIKKHGRNDGVVHKIPNTATEDVLFDVNVQTDHSSSDSKTKK